MLRRGLVPTMRDRAKPSLIAAAAIVFALHDVFFPCWLMLDCMLRLLLLSIYVDFVANEEKEQVRA